MDIAILLFLIGIVVTLVVGSVFYLKSNNKRDKITAWIFMIKLRNDEHVESSYKFL